MKKFLFALAVLSGLAFSSFAQTKTDDGNKFSIGVEPGIPVGNISNFYSFVIGGSLKYERTLNQQAAFTLSAGYSSFIGKSGTIGGISFKSTSAGFVPVKAGLKCYITDAFYGEGQLGAVFSTQSGGGTAFVYAPGIGYKFSPNVDLGVRYEGWSKDGTIGQIAFRLAYNF
ncbi:MAG TPA: outer membrane beta-barrel protein [Mucilaginibacter sp.]|jgi:hypothetical protein|nr:outer membrane beta-barrel protein [Mucilaginibacter sp.]